MFDIKLIRENIELVKKGLAAKNAKVSWDEIVKLDVKRRDLLSELDQLRNKKNVANDEITEYLKAKKDPKAKIASMKEISSQIDQLDPQVRDLDKKLATYLLGIPNLPHESVPVGTAEKNKEVRTWGSPKKLDFKPQTHIEIAEKLDIIDFKRASKLSGSNFILFKGAGARLERALYNFMLDVHTAQHGYT